MHDRSLVLMEEEVLRWRAKLLQASEAVAEFGEKFLAKVDYKPLDSVALAAQQRRIIQKHLGAFHAPSHGNWLIETDIKSMQNRLNKTVATTSVW